MTTPTKTAFAVAAVLAVSFLPAAAAPPADQDACNKTAFELAELAASKKLAEADAVKVDELVSKLEGQCADGKLTDADATTKEIEAALGK
jgi:hypothetical protein